MEDATRDNSADRQTNAAQAVAAGGAKRCWRLHTYDQQIIQAHGVLKHLQCSRTLRSACMLPVTQP
jgi:hypothetical protein